MILPVILAGGSGERLWPLSRTAYPKQFLTLPKILNGAEHSLFQNTIQRLPTNSNFLPPLVVCHEEYRFIIAEQLRQINRTTSGIILEPSAKNTAPAIALAAHWAQQHCPQCILLILPADHLINDLAMLQQTIINATPSALEGLLVTFGITIVAPETGYGYIKIGANNRISRFIEKPDATTAQTFMNNPEYLWNSGMFFFTPAAYMHELSAHQPEIAACVQEAMNICIYDLDFIRPNANSYVKCTSISIDYAVMECTNKAAVFPLNSAWSDIGNWQAVWEQSPKDAAGNCIQGDVITQNSSNCLIDARHRLLATINVHDLIIIETSDAVLVAHKDQSQELKNLVSKLKSQGHPAATEHRKVIRPWGWYDTITKGDRFQVKLICVHPQKSLSLQSHKYRSEHWIVVKGNAKVIRGDETLLLTENESTFIPQGFKHQLTNCGNIPLELIEVQSGTYLGEDDIIRYADEHGRAVSNETHA